MLRRLSLRCLLGAFALSIGAATSSDASPRVSLETTRGEIVIELFADRAPVTTANFLRYVEDGFYDGLIFHRVIPGFVIQGGGYGPDLSLRPTRAPVVSEAKNGLENARGTVAMARTEDPDSADSQFYVNLRDNTSLDQRPGRPGYTVFGRVVEGMDVVDAIAQVPTGTTKGQPDVPVEPVVIERVRKLP